MFKVTHHTHTHTHTHTQWLSSPDLAQEVWLVKALFETSQLNRLATTKSPIVDLLNSMVPPPPSPPPFLPHPSCNWHLICSLQRMHQLVHARNEHVTSCTCIETVTWDFRASDLWWRLFPLVFIPSCSANRSESEWTESMTSEDCTDKLKPTCNDS